MGRFLVRRGVQGVAVIVAVTLLVFVVVRLVGDPVNVLLPMQATAEQREAFAHQLGIDRPILAQLGEYLRDVTRLEFGDSLWQRRPALAIVLEKLPTTLKLAITGMVVATVLAVPLGIAAAVRPGSLLDRITVQLSMLGLSIPQFWLGLMFIMLFAVELGWLPTSGSTRTRHLILPALTLALPLVGRLAMMIRSSTIDVMNEPYVKMAVSRGLPRRRIMGVHVLRNASVPVVSLVGWEFVRVLAGYGVVVEAVFAWQGVGLVALQAIVHQDIILLQTIVLVVAAIVVVINFSVDVGLKWLDRRVSL